MTKTAPWFVEERAVAFASLLLTKRKGVKVRAEAGSERGIDLLVEIFKDGLSALRFFGVQLVPSLDLPELGEEDGYDLSPLPRETQGTALPVCVFVIGVRKPEGVFRWLMEPVIENGRALLRSDGESNWRTLDEAAAACMIDQVSDWYDALQNDITLKNGDGLSLS